MHLASDLNRTVAELEVSLTLKEYNKWKMFRTERPFNTQEIQLAVMSYMLSSSLGGSADVTDFMVTPVEGSEKDKPLTGDELNEALKGAFG